MQLSLLLAIALYKATTQSHAQAVLSGCNVGDCQPTSSGYEVCAGSVWHRVDTGLYSCEGNQIRPKSTTLTTAHTRDPSPTSKCDNERCIERLSASLSSEDAPKAEVGQAGRTGYSFCNKQPNVERTTAQGRASYRKDGKMASMYEAGPSSVFRCDGIAYPEDGFYVAFWTPFDTGLQGKSQPAPNNCGDKLTLKNPMNGREARAVVLDRCASCVGVDRTPTDPTTPLNLVNGATVDLSSALWRYLYDGEEGGVFDIEYDGSAYAGSSGEPRLLQESDRAQCSGPL